MNNTYDENLTKALSGDYEFSIKSVISNAWFKVKGVKSSYWGAFGLYLAIIIGISIIGGIIFGIASLFFTIPSEALKQGAAHMQHPVSFIILQLVRAVFELFIMAFITLPMLAGVFLIGLRWTKLKEASTYYIFRFYKKKYIWNLFLMWFCSTLVFMVLGAIASAAMGTLSAADLGLPIKALFITSAVLCILALIYCMVSFMFAFPLIVDRGMKGIQAIRVSTKAVSHRWFKVFGFFIVVSFFILISGLPLFIGFIWSFPWTYNALAEAYKSIFGIAGQDPVTLEQ